MQGHHGAVLAGAPGRLVQLTVRVSTSYDITVHSNFQAVRPVAGFTPFYRRFPSYIVGHGQHSNIQMHSVWGAAVFNWILCPG
jgi:hypothetical protein